ncbi:MAG: hypothetical protein HY904_24305 [Deltaproteobacteria bacterium]|nr:hypothetical protein [Deltaproteobacteria bacterium]
MECLQTNPNSTWDVIARSATFQTTQGGGESWDALGGAPDGFICWFDNCAAGTGSACTAVTSDAFSATFNTTLASSITASTLMNTSSAFCICLYDEDATTDDIAGCVGGGFATAADIQAGQVSLTLQANLQSSPVVYGNAGMVIGFVAH